VAGLQMKMLSQDMAFLSIMILHPSCKRTLRTEWTCYSCSVTKTAKYWVQTLVLEHSPTELRLP